MKALQAHMYVHHVHACWIPGTTMYAEEPILVFYKKEITAPKTSPAPVFCAYRYPDLST